MNESAAGLDPEHLWNHFTSLAAIPRPSKEEKAVADWVLGLAREHRFGSAQDAAGNVVVRVPARGRDADAPTIVLQAHLDMVCEKNHDSDHDFRKDPIVPVRDGEWVRAEGTTLGADNGIGVAAALAAATDPSVVHGPLELLFTIDEETGLTGAAELDGDLISGRILLNLDSESDGQLYIGCAGGEDTLFRGGATHVDPPAGAEVHVLSVTGLRGGHSGMEIVENRGNAIRILAGTLRELLKNLPDIRIGGFRGGGLPNAIPREAFAEIWVPSDRAGRVEELLHAHRSASAGLFRSMGETVTIDIRPAELSEIPCWEPEAAGRLVDFLLAVPNGVLGMSGEIDGLVESSINLAAVRPVETTDPGTSHWVVHTSARSSVAGRLREIRRDLRSLARLSGQTVEHTDAYPGWEPNLDSEALRVATDVYREHWKREPEVTAIHAGLECGLLGLRIPGVDMVSLGPRIEGAHTPEERVNIASVQRFWRALSEILRRL